MTLRIPYYRVHFSRNQYITYTPVVCLEYLLFFIIIILNFLQTQEREAKNKMWEKAKELQRQKIEAKKLGKSSFGNSGGFGTATTYNATSSVGDVVNASNDMKTSSYAAPQ